LRLGIGQRLLQIGVPLNLLLLLFFCLKALRDLIRSRGTNSPAVFAVPRVALGEPAEGAAGAAHRRLVP
jgi:hypothetical protein